MSFNESKSFNQYYPKGNIGHFDTMSSQYANAFERFEYESQTITNDRMSEYQVPQTSAKYSFPTVGSDTEVLEIDTKNHFPLLQAYNSEEIPKLLVESCDPIEENTELKQKNLQKGSVTLSVVGECIRTACDILLGIYPWNTDHLFVNTDSQFMSLISSDSKKESSFSEAELWDRNVQNNTENKCKKLKSDNNLFKHGSGLSKSLRYNSSKPLTEEPELRGNFENFNTTTLLQENALERLENEYQTMVNDRMWENQGYIHEEIPISLDKCCDPSEESTEVKRKKLQEGSVTLSAVGHCIRTACDTLLGMDFYDTDYFLETTDSQFMGTISSNSINLASFMEPELLARNVKKKSESKRENLRSENNLCKQDSSLSPSKRAGKKVFQCERRTIPVRGVPTKVISPK
ncbi:hypothetical protein NPIL_329791 [Nephila pilipes]|uniref:Uncharacterized protein n=1 Tax=Nephila pilipes TaxID=299642 RepID=A0A8X6PHA3_NEPPI|nr:hypothetical protein NPIL_329791 [Nephila pilipes]